jgi:hypothetical protein
MTDLEDRLRHDLRTSSQLAEPESIRPLRQPPPRRRSRAVRYLAPAMAVAAIIGIVAGVSLAGRAVGRRPAPPAATGSAGMPKYYVTLRVVQPTSVRPGYMTATVRDSATGAYVSSVQVARLRPGGFPGGTGIVAAANDRVFAIFQPLGTDILRLAPDGKVAGLRLLPKRFSSYLGAVLSPDGTELALPVNTKPIASCKTPKTPGCSGGLALISLTTGASRTWYVPDFVTPVYPVSWPGTGHDVVVDYKGWRLLNVAGPGGNLLTDSRRIASPIAPRGWVLAPELLTPDGKALIMGGERVTVTHSEVDAGGILEFSARTGRLLRMLYFVTVPRQPLSWDMICGADALGPTGLNILIECGDSHLGRLAGSHFTSLPMGPASIPAYDSTAAW